MSKNIKIEYKKGKAETYITQATEDLYMPSLGFRREEDAELAVAIAKAMKSRGIDTSNLHQEVKYVFRLLKLEDSGWC